MRRRTDPKSVIQPFDYEGVQLLDGLLGSQFRNIRDFYYSIPNDSILKDFRLKAGLPAPGKELGGIHGMSPFGQWLSAFARMYRATNDTGVRDKAVCLMDEWATTVSEEEWSRSVHHYTFDKLVCGLVDIYKYIGNKNALQHLERITKWAEKNLDRSRHYTEGGEWYTLSENLYRAYEVTGEKRYFDFAKVWEYTEYWGHFARNEDIFTALKDSQNKAYHAYSHVNTLSGAAMAYKLTGERHYLDTIINAYQYLQDTQCFATGGYGPDEQLIIPDLLPQTLERIRRARRVGEIIYSFFLESNPYINYHFETACGSWAGFKLARHLMTLTGEAHYGDWIERLVYNGVGAIIPTNKEGMIMYGSRYHLYGAQKTVWAPWSCCTGTLPQAVTEYHNLIYFHDQESIYVNLFVPSKVEWKGPDGIVTIIQETQFPEQDIVLIHVQPETPSRFSLKFRVPGWTESGVSVKVNNAIFKTATVPGKWAIIYRKWNPNDTVTLKFDLSPRIEPLTRYVSPVAILCGPVAMVTTADPRGIPSDKDLKHPSDWLKRSKGRFAYSSSMQAWDQVFRPYYEIKEGEYYQMYFERPDGVSTSPDELVFHDSWSSDGTIRYAQIPGSYFEGKFRGTTFVWEGLRTEDAGIAEVSIDGKKVAEVDQYGYTGAFWDWIDQREVPFIWSTSGLDEGEHIIRITILPRKNPNSQGTRVNLKRLIVYP